MCMLQYKSPGAEQKLTKQKAEEHARKGPAFAPAFAGHTMPKPHEYLANPIPQAKVCCASHVAHLNLVIVGHVLGYVMCTVLFSSRMRVRLQKTGAA